jgi:hypothetical protein
MSVVNIPNNLTSMFEEVNKRLRKLETVGGFLTQAAAASIYLTQANAAATYLTIANATSTYLTQSNAATTYVAKSGDTMTGTLNGTTFNATNFTKAGVSVVPAFQRVVTNGAVGTNYTLTVPVKSLCTLLFSASGYVTGGGLYTFTLNINGAGNAVSQFYFNQTFVHASCPMGIGLATLNAGSYNLQVVFNGASDVNDFVNIFATMVPVA